jgi:hypothetical protein
MRSPRSRRAVQLSQPYQRQRHDLRREVEEAEACRRLGLLVERILSLLR